MRIDTGENTRNIFQCDKQESKRQKQSSDGILRIDILKRITQ